MSFFQRWLHDFERLRFHYDIVTLYGLFFQRVVPILGMGCIALGLVLAGYALADPPGSERRGVRRVALGATLSVLGVGLYTVVPIGLDSVGLTPSQGHLRFYGMFFLPVGALAGALAVAVGCSRAFAPRADRPAQRFSVAGYGAGFVVMWLVFLLYSWIILGTTMNVGFGLIRATVTAALGAIFFALAPYLISVVDQRPAQRLLSWGYGLVVAGAISLLLAQVVTQVLSLRSDLL